MINKKAQTGIGDILLDNIVYLIILISFFSGMFIFIFNQTNGASIWADYYSKEISKIINSANSGDTITLNVQKATEIAQDNEVRSLSEIFTFNNAENEICTKLAPGRKICYKYFNNIDIANQKLNLKDETNKFIFTINEKTK